MDLQLLTEAPTQTLIDELATLEASLEGLRTAAAAAKEDLKECLAYLVEAHDALGLDMDPAWQDIESDLMARRREQFHNKKAETKEELSTRMAAVVQLVCDCQQMMEDLRMEPEMDGSELDRRIAARWCARKTEASSWHPSVAPTRALVSVRKRLRN
jgi:hypothetical protein